MRLEGRAVGLHNSLFFSTVEFFGTLKVDEKLAVIGSVSLASTVGALLSCFLCFFCLFFMLVARRTGSQGVHKPARALVSSNLQLFDAPEIYTIDVLEGA